MIYGLLFPLIYINWAIYFLAALLSMIPITLAMLTRFPRNSATIIITASLSISACGLYLAPFIFWLFWFYSDTVISDNVGLAIYRGLFYIPLGVLAVVQICLLLYRRYSDANGSTAFVCVNMLYILTFISFNEADLYVLSAAYGMLGMVSVVFLLHAKASGQVRSWLDFCLYAGFSIFVSILFGPSLDLQILDVIYIYLLFVWVWVLRLSFIAYWKWRLRWKGSNLSMQTRFNEFWIFPVQEPDFGVFGSTVPTKEKYQAAFLRLWDNHFCCPHGEHRLGPDRTAVEKFFSCKTFFTLCTCN